MQYRRLSITISNQRCYLTNGGLEKIHPVWLWVYSILANMEIVHSKRVV